MQNHKDQNAHADAIFIAQMAILRRNFPFALLGSLLTVGLIVIALWNVLPQRELIAWLVLNIAVMALRIGVMRTYKVAQNEVLALRRWGQRMLWCTALAGVVWGLPYGYWLFQAPFEYQMFMIIGLLTLGTGAIYAYCIYMPLLLAFEIPYFLPSFIALAVDPDILHHVLAAAGMLYLFVTLAFAQRMYRTQRDSLQMRFENRDLLERLAIEKEAAERSKEAADRSNQAKSQFLAAASHDLRQPVHALSLYVGVLREQTLNAKSRQLVDHIGRATAAMGSLFDGLLNISRLDAGVIRPRLRHCSLTALFNQLQLEYAPQAAAKSLILRLHHASVPAVYSDPVLLDRILRNLVDNAIRHTKRGGILIGCRRRGQFLQVEVWDTGVGIAPADQEKIFMEFHQIGNPERNQNKGLGLGLAIVRRTADLLGHRLTLRSRPGRGSVFTLTLPLFDEKGVHASTTITPPISLHDDAPQGKTIFVIEDDEDNLQGVRLLLEAWGYQVVAGASGDEIVQAAANCTDTPALILSDFRLRDHETGIAVIDRLHDEYADDTIPAILMTGDTDPQRLAEASARAWPLLHKPVDAAHLRQVIVETIAQAARSADRAVQ
ncbi:ATP-binding response regulator [Herminiimonas arsenitoxidans]|uniref:ATP-binding response regulator n=1 Tax=Herminiimonas arsenitoxidans TaxID=1809410 RepID=UPI001E2C536C|nr:hybrid sensor histidine kinase/response regulator [Herminiimonas arsenitoxidans]